jgi:hypothetical protein
MVHTTRGSRWETSGRRRGRAGSGVRRAAAELLACGLLVASGWLMLPAPARADTGGYPDANMPCEWFPQATSGPAGTQWCADFDWGPVPSTLFAGQESIQEETTISPRGFGYRNCTDYVAYKLGITASVVHGNAAQWRAELPPSEVTGYPTVGAVAWWGPEVDQGLGHVAVVLAVQPGGEALIGEYNANLDGTYDTRLVRPSTVDAFLHIRDQAVPGGVPFSPPRPSVAPAPPIPSPTPSPTPPAIASPAPTPAASPTGPPAGLTSTVASYVSLSVPSFLRSGTSTLVTARVDRSAALSGILDPVLDVHARGTAPAATLSATLHGASLEASPTTPEAQPVGGPDLWQWRVRPTGAGPHTLSVCLSVAAAVPPPGQAAAPPAQAAAPPAQATSAACTAARTVAAGRVSSTTAGAGWLAGGAVVVGGAAAAVATRRRRNRAA